MFINFVTIMIIQSQPKLIEDMPFSTIAVKLRIVKFDNAKN